MRMTALSFAQYGPPTVLSLIEREAPVPRPGEVLVRSESVGDQPERRSKCRRGLSYRRCLGRRGGTHALGLCFLLFRGLSL